MWRFGRMVKRLAKLSQVSPLSHRTPCPPSSSFACKKSAGKYQVLKSCKTYLAYVSGRRSFFRVLRRGCSLQESGDSVSSWGISSTIPKPLVGSYTASLRRLDLKQEGIGCVLRGRREWGRCGRRGCSDSIDCTI